MCAVSSRTGTLLTVQFGAVVSAWGEHGDPSHVHALVSAAEDLGYDTAWFGDHVVIPGYARHVSHPNWYEPLACCLVEAGRTTRLRFATDVLVAPYRNPVALAKTLSTADRLCGGRLTLGVGVGYIRGEFEALGAPPYEQRGEVTDEYLAVLRLLWESDGPVSFRGAHVELHDVWFAPTPAQRPLPILVGGNGPRAFRRAARLGDGWHPLFPAPEAYAAGRAAIARRRAEEGRDGPFTYSYSCPPCHVVTDRVAPPLVAVPEGEVPAEYGYAPPFPVDTDGRPLFVGTPDELVRDVAALEAAGVEHVALRFWSGSPGFTVDDIVEQMRRFATDVAPAFAS